MNDRITDLDKLKEAKGLAAMQSSRYQQAMSKYHARHVWDKSCAVGDLVLRKIQSMKDKHKLSPPYEGPFIISEVLRLDAYWLQLEDDAINRFYV